MPNLLRKFWILAFILAVFVSADCGFGTAYAASSKPQINLTYDGDVFQWDDVSNYDSAVQITFRDEKGASILERNAKGETVYRPYFSNWKTATIEMFWGGYYQSVSQTIINPGPKPFTQLLIKPSPQLFIAIPFGILIILTLYILIRKRSSSRPL